MNNRPNTIKGNRVLRIRVSTKFGPFMQFNGKTLTTLMLRISNPLMNFEYDVGIDILNDCNDIDKI
jgi:hypothetical protein